MADWLNDCGSTHSTSTNQPFIHSPKNKNKIGRDEMEEKELYPVVLEKVSRDFSTTTTKIEVVEDYAKDIKALKEHLSKKVAEMMDKDFDRFLNNMYLIDVSETKVREVLNNSPFGTIPEQLAELIIERQLQRIKTQQLYREGKL